ncbi:MAG: VOC family protein [Polaromonas sp.]|uniref:VOC family protein n=1 Tax=Polaromonas sp. TaxID=1869339 RepID=UPI002734BE67|nr:VOC family protein [Polaromonas sp.]MDP2820396.1 VOC family protein [Polaromonas sp.]
MLPVCVQTISVSDFEEAVRFYTQGLGYEVKATYGPCIVQLNTGSTTLILQQIETGSQPASPATVLSFQTEDIQAFMRKIVKAGGELVHAEPQRCPVDVFVMFRDRAGVLYNLLQFDTA